MADTKEEPDLVDYEGEEEEDAGAGAGAGAGKEESK